MCVFSHSVMSDSFVTPWAVAPPGYSVRGIFPARILEWVTIFSSYWHAISYYMFCAFTLNSYLIIYKLSGQRTLSLFEVSIISECCWCWTGFLSGASCKEFACHAGDPRNVGLTPGSGRSGEGNGSPLQYSCLENPMDRGVWQATVRQDHKELDTTEHLSRGIEWNIMLCYETFSYSVYITLIALLAC